MADILLQYRECEDGDLPKACCVCGQGRAHFVQITLKSHIGGGPDTIIYRIVEAQLPLCDDHRGHFQRPLYITLAAFGGMILVFFLAIAATIALIPTLTTGIFVVAPIAVLLCLASMVGAIVIAVMSHRGIVRAKTINERGVYMVNVSPKFVRAVKDYREGGGRSGRDDDDRPRRRRRDEDDDYDEDDDRPRRRRRD